MNFSGGSSQLQIDRNNFGGGNKIWECVHLFCYINTFFLEVQGSWLLRARRHILINCYCYLHDLFKIV